ncbi:DNA cytosine methyltransferase [Dehalobacter sp. DCM]|uniref:DNA cytosine methyltransferase n=1 Tax=Dehalobacter sp. DCM TaxID=2907827 RepID=UPI003082189D|nr:DNA cytosine methyltransferase [Dehalobacter sp. DCM]
MTYPVISLFSGAMGLDLGLEKAGLDIKIGQDFDPWCAKTATSNSKPFVLGDIRQLLIEDPSCKFLLEPAGLIPGEAFAVVGGPPCQPFSTAGKRLGTQDPRGSLFMEFVKVIKVVRPRFFIMENVKGLLSAAIKHVPLDERNGKPVDPEELPGSVFHFIRETFQELGYKLVHGILDASHYGVPQFRERLFIIGSRDYEDIFLPVPTHFQFHQDLGYRWLTLRDAIEDLEGNPGPYTTFSAERLKYLRLVPMGGNWRNLPPDIVESAMGGAYNSGGGKVGFYRRLDYEQPSPTLVTSPVQKATMLCHPIQDRPLSIREYARIQQFPDDWIIEGSISDCYRQIGNAVPLGLGKAVGQMLLAVANGTAKINTRRFRGTSIHDNLARIQNIMLEAN